MNAEKLKWMAQHNGVYILTDTIAPAATFPIVVQGADPAKGLAGQMHSLQPSRLVSQDVSQWRPTTECVGGPFSAQSCEAAEADTEFNDDRMEFWKSTAIKCRPSLILFRDVMLQTGRQDAAAAAQALLDAIDEVAKAEEKAGSILEQIVLQQMHNPKTT